MPLEPWEKGLEDIREHHVRNFRETDKRLLGYLRKGLTDTEIAEVLVVAESSVRRQMAELEHRVFDLTDLAPTRLRLAIFAVEHQRCCLG